jgi:hypothetical protein
VLGTMVHTERRRSNFWVTLAIALALVMASASPAWAHDEIGNHACGVGDHVYTKIRYTDGYSQSYIDATNGTTQKTHQTVSTWVNRYHQPRDGGAAYFELREKTSLMSHTYSWPACED